MIKFIDYFYPLQKLSNNYLERYETKNVKDVKTSIKNNSNVISIIIFVIYLLIMVYTTYLLTKCLRQKDSSGNFVNNVSEFIAAIFFLPIYLFYRSFINPCSAPKVSNSVNVPAPAPVPTPNPNPVPAPTPNPTPQSTNN